LDLNGAGISTVIWATGFQYDFGWVHLPIFAQKGETAPEPVHRRGITDIAGDYFLGLQWLSKRKSSLMAGVGEDAEFIARHIAMRS
jgi:putative flavoprotein involved in K+ transport